MKLIVRTFIAAVCAVVACIEVDQAAAQAAQTELVGWNVESQADGAGGAPPATFASTTNAANVLPGTLTKSTNSPGIEVVPTEDEAYGGNGWTNIGYLDNETNSISNGLFIQYTVQAAPGYVISFTTNFLNFHSSSTGPSQAALQYCTDGVSFSNIALIAYGGGGGTSTVTGTNIVNLSTNAFLQNVPSSKTNFFRLVNWGATSSNGTWYIYNSSSTNAGLQLLGSVAYELAGWNVNSLPDGAGGAPPADFAATTVAANVTAGDLTKSTTSPGIQVVATEDEAYGGNGWTNSGFADSETNSIANGLFIAYSAQAAPGFTLSFSENFLNFHTSSTGPSLGALQYCTDGVSYSNIAAIVYGGGGGTPTVTGTNLIDLSTNAFLQDVPSTVTNYFRIVNWGATSTGGTWYIYNSDTLNPGLQLLGSVNSATGGAVAPTNLDVTPADVTTNAGSTVEFTVTATGSPPTYTWYQGTPGSATAVPNATNAILTLPGVLGGNSGSYFVVLSNATGSATSSVVTLTVTGDPGVIFNPNSAFGLLDGTVQFSVTSAATSPTYSWYLDDTNDNTLTLINNGLQANGSTVSGATTGTLTISDLQAGDTNNYVVVISNVYNSVTSAPAALISVSTTTVPLAFWDFNGVDFTNVALIPYPNTGLGTSLLNPPPYYGVGTASAVGGCLDPGTSPFSGSVDPEDGFGTPYPQDGQAEGLNFSWGTDNYPLTGGNKQNGVQFMVSTVGAKDITISYDSRVSATASDYERVQYTTNAGADWTDYPASSTFGGTATTYKNFAYNLTGFPGVPNNPNFGFQVVTEYQSTATYGIGTDGGLPAGITNNYVGTDNTYGTTGTVTYDIVFVNGAAITNTYSPPVIGPISYVATSNQLVVISTNGVTNLDYVPLTNMFTIGSATTPVNALTISAKSLNPSAINPNFEFGLSGSNVTMIISPYSIANSYAAAPILVTVTDTNGDSTVAWFLLTLQSLNLPPTNTLATLTSTNMLANSSLSIPFVVGAYDGTNTGLTFSSNSVNNTVMPTANIVITGENTTNPTVTFTPATNQLGIAPVSIAVDDNNPIEPKTTTANFSVMVRPNTNIVLIDYFNYDNPGSLDAVPGGVWTHLSGPDGQMQFGSDTVTVDTLNNTENVQTPLLGAPYYVNSAASNTAPVLYASFIVSMNNRTALPLTNGTYFAVFNDGSGVTGNYNGGIWISTNDAAQGDYRLGIVNFPSAEGDGFVLFPQDLVPNSNYIVVASLTLSNSFSTIWVDPVNSSSPSVSDNTTASGIAATNFNIKDFELRESGALGGTVTMSTLKVGTTFDSVLPSLHIQEAGTNVVLTWSDPTLSIQSTTDLTQPWVDVVGATTPYTNAIVTNSAMYFRFGQ